MKWLAQVDSNHRPRAYQARALTTWAMSHYRGRPRCRDSPLSFRFVHLLLETFICLSWTRTRVRWWRWWDSNPWPPACRAGALPAELHPHIAAFGNDICFADDITSWWYPYGWYPRFRSGYITTWTMGFCFFSKRSFKIEQRIDSYLDKTVCYVAYMLVMYGRFSIERRWSSRTFRYGYLVTT